ncbi:MAG: carbonic anhydrase [Desulfobacterales bacterium SG8_35_2]|nr:MAG: carbonic anhydrase [Desulfobacterales bacterium SG8_35_2]
MEESKKEQFVSSKEWRDSHTAEQILQLLKEGNEAFVSGEQLERDQIYARVKTSKGQYPAAIILGCIDSRAPNEIIFNLGIGDIFSARVAGNFVNTDIVASMEYACKVAGSKVIFVLGHTECGAIKSACDNVELGNITFLLENIKPALESAKDVPGEHNSKNKKFVEAVTKQNVLLTIERIQQLSPILREMIHNKEVLIAGGLYDVASGKILFY